MNVTQNASTHQPFTMELIRHSSFARVGIRNQTHNICCIDSAFATRVPPHVEPTPTMFRHVNAILTFALFCRAREQVPFDMSTTTFNWNVKFNFQLTEFIDSIFWPRNFSSSRRRWAPRARNFSTRQTKENVPNALQNVKCTAVYRSIFWPRHK